MATQQNAAKVIRKILSHYARELIKYPTTLPFLVPAVEVQQQAILQVQRIDAVVGILQFLDRYEHEPSLLQACQKRRTDIFHIMEYFGKQYPRDYAEPFDQLVAREAAETNECHFTPVPLLDLEDAFCALMETEKSVHLNRATSSWGRFVTTLLLHSTVSSRPRATEQGAVHQPSHNLHASSSKSPPPPPPTKSPPPPPPMLYNCQCRNRKCPEQWFLWGWTCHGDER